MYMSMVRSVASIEIVELECGLYCCLLNAMEPLRGTKMVAPRWQKDCYAVRCQIGFSLNLSYY